MAVYYVFQGNTYDDEHTGGYVWSHKFNKAGHKNAGYEMMKNIFKGDYIFHNFKGKIVALSIAQTNCFETSPTKKLPVEGYRINTRYYELEVPLITKYYEEWLRTHYLPCSAFAKNGKGKQQYMCHLANKHAVYILQEIVKIQKNKQLINILKSALPDIIGDNDYEYNQVELDSINELLNLDTDVNERPTWPGRKEAQIMTVSGENGREVPKRDYQTAISALERANYLCEYDSCDRTFLRKSGKPYTEPHHLIPISKYHDFDYSVDVMENIVSLCSNCHNLLHYGRFEDKVPLLKKLYKDRVEALKKCGLKITLDQLEIYYKS